MLYYTVFFSYYSDLGRMRQAIDSLIQSPQNNFRIFEVSLQYCIDILYSSFDSKYSITYTHLMNNFYFEMLEFVIFNDGEEDLPYTEPCE